MPKPLRGGSVISIEFPSAEAAIPSGAYKGLVAVGGDLSEAQLLAAYRNGIFPWTVHPVTWWSPNPRGILETFHVSRSLRRILSRTVVAPEVRLGPQALVRSVNGKGAGYRVTLDRAFVEVMEQCARQGRPGQWITAEFIAAYSKLHQHGYTHSVECWDGDVLAGGLYGVALGGLFAAESMFYRKSNASKVALYVLVEHLHASGFTLLDIQVPTAATRQLGGKEIPRSEYLSRLRAALQCNCSFR